MSNTALHTDKAPAAIGPYSQGIQAGNTIYVSGQIPIDPATGEFAGQDIKTQTRQSLTNISDERYLTSRPALWHLAPIISGDRSHENDTIAMPLTKDK